MRARFEVDKVVLEKVSDMRILPRFLMMGAVLASIPAVEKLSLNRLSFAVGARF